MKFRDTPTTWWGIILSVIIVIGVGFYLVSMLGPNDHIGPTATTGSTNR
jgi:hypothetical protein